MFCGGAEGTSLPVLKGNRRGSSGRCNLDVCKVIVGWRGGGEVCGERMGMADERQGTKNKETT